VPDTYKTCEIIKNDSYPGKDYWNPATGGCSSRHMIYPAQNQVDHSWSSVFYNSISDTGILASYPQKGKQHGYPPYHMTNLTKSRTITRNFLLKRRNASAGYHVYEQHLHTSMLPPPAGCTIVIDWVDQYKGWQEWYDVTHNEPVGTTYVVSQIRQADIDSTMASVRNNVSVEALTSYDFLTDLVEAREIPKLLMSVARDLSMITDALRGHFSMSDLRTAARIKPRQLLQNPMKVLRKLGEEWMSYRYGIMPLVYSCRDIKKTLDRGIDNTTRKSSKVQPVQTGVSLPGPTSQYKWQEETGSVSIRGTVFQNYSFESAAQMAGVGFNLFSTAWEEIPYSFVIDWFVNIGDYIRVKTTQSLARVNYACISQRQTRTVSKYLHYPNQDFNLSLPAILGTNWYGPTPPSSTLQPISRPEESQIINSITTESYVRQVFALGDVQLQFNPSLNWRRLIDAAVMSMQPIKRFSSALKG